MSLNSAICCIVHFVACYRTFAQIEMATSEEEREELQEQYEQRYVNHKLREARLPSQLWNDSKLVHTALYKDVPGTWLFLSG